MCSSEAVLSVKQEFEVGSEYCLGEWWPWIKGRWEAGGREDSAGHVLLLEGADWGSASEEQSWVGRNIAQVKCLSLAYVSIFLIVDTLRILPLWGKQPMTPALPSSSHRRQGIRCGNPAWI